AVLVPPTSALRDGPPCLLGAGVVGDEPASLRDVARDVEETSSARDVVLVADRAELTHQLGQGVGVELEQIRAPEGFGACGDATHQARHHGRLKVEAAVLPEAL